MKNEKFHDVVVKLFGTAFLGTIFIVSMITWKKFIPQFFKTVSSTKISMETKTKLEDLFNESICWKNGWITLYGGSQRALLKHEINNFEVVKDNAGFLCVPVNKKSAEKISKQVDNLQYFAKLCESRKIPFLFVMAPGEVILDKSVLPTGVNDFSNENMDMFLQELSERDIPFLDTRTLFEEIPLEDICYKTDHHWALPITFKTFSEIITTLNEKHLMGLDKGGQYRNLENYICKSYPNCFLGSRGIKVGEWYAGMDLFRIYVPKFKTSLINQYYVKSKLKWTKNGDFWNAMIDEALLKNNGYYNKYNAFMYGSMNESRITNKLSDNDSCLLLISDSFGRQLIPYMSLCFSETAWLDPQSGRYNDSYTKYIDEFKPDCVVILFNGRSCYVDIPV